MSVFISSRLVLQIIDPLPFKCICAHASFTFKICYSSVLIKFYSHLHRNMAQMARINYFRIKAVRILNSNYHWFNSASEVRANFSGWSIIDLSNRLEFHFCKRQLPVYIYVLIEHEPECFCAWCNQLSSIYLFPLGLTEHLNAEKPHNSKERQ